MANVDTSRLIRLVVAGAAGGLVIFLVFNPSIAREELYDDRIVGDLLQHVMDVFFSTAVLSACYAALVGGMLILSDEFGSPGKRVALRVLTAAGIGAVVGLVAGVVAQFIYVVAGFVLQIAGRAIGWAAMGAGTGAGVGLALGSWRRVWICTVGGAAGGFVGGFLFDAISVVTGTGSLSRLIGFIVMGASTGAAIAFAEDIAKRSWVTILSGAKEGRNFILSKPITTVGRDELADVPLFGDPSIQKQHARFTMQQSAVTVQAIGPVAINGSPAQYAQLRDSDVVTLGSMSMRFHQKAGQNVPIPGPGQPQYAQPPAPVPPSAYAPAEPGPGQPGPAQNAAVATGQMALSVVSGPHQGQSFSFGPGTIQIGREAGCDVLLPEDAMVSRNHAQISWTGSNWSIADLASTNGLYVNGARVTQQSLNVGDQIRVGQTTLRVDGT